MRKSKRERRRSTNRAYGRNREADGVHKGIDSRSIEIHGWGGSWKDTAES